MIVIVLSGTCFSFKLLTYLLTTPTVFAARLIVFVLLFGPRLRKIPLSLLLNVLNADLLEYYSLAYREC